MELFSSKKNRRYERLLLEELSKTSAGAISVWNVINRANGAITYNERFIELAADLMFLYRKNSVKDPVARLSGRFQEYKIYTCRGNVMDYSRAKYFYERHLKPILVNMSQYKHAHTVGRKQCALCSKFFVNLDHHQANCGTQGAAINPEQ